MLRISRPPSPDGPQRLAAQRLRDTGSRTLLRRHLLSADDARGRPGFKSVLDPSPRSFSERPDEIMASAKRVADRIREQLAGNVAMSSSVPSPEVFDRAFDTLKNGFDSVHGGIGRPPKFPSSLRCAFCCGDIAARPSRKPSR